MPSMKRRKSLQLLPKYLVLQNSSVVLLPLLLWLASLLLASVSQLLASLFSVVFSLKHNS